MKGQISKYFQAKYSFCQVTNSLNRLDQGEVPIQPIPKLSRSQHWNSWAKLSLYLSRNYDESKSASREKTDHWGSTALLMEWASAESPGAALSPDSRGVTLLESWPWVSMNVHFHYKHTTSLWFITPDLISRAYNQEILSTPSPSAQVQLPSLRLRKSPQFILYPRLQPRPHPFPFFLLRSLSHPPLPAKHQDLLILSHH